jgi:hypothetical protein
MEEPFHIRLGEYVTADQDDCQSTDWEVGTEAQALRIFPMCCQRWGVEDCFKFTKDGLGWQEVQLLDLAGIQMLVAVAWVAAGFFTTWERLATVNCVMRGCQKQPLDSFPRRVYSSSL